MVKVIMKNGRKLSFPTATKASEQDGVLVIEIENPTSIGLIDKLSVKEVDSYQVVKLPPKIKGVRRGR